MFDPYPRKVLLSQKECMVMLSMDRSTWFEFRADPQNGFPLPVVVGRTPNGHPRHRWKKWEVIAWYERLQHDDTPPPDGRKKK